MAVPKQKFREAVFLCLFSLSGGTNSPHLSELVMEELKITKKNVCEAKELAEKIYSERAAFDEHIRRASTAYEFERIPQVELNILRLGLAEMKTLPPAVAISEAIRLTRKFSTAEAASYVNAILDSLLRNATP